MSSFVQPSSSECISTVFDSKTGVIVAVVGLAVDKSGASKDALGTCDDTRRFGNEIVAVVGPAIDARGATKDVFGPYDANKLFESTFFVK